MRNLLFLLLPIALFTSFTGKFDKPSYHRVAAKAGDDIVTLMSRYDLQQYKCNYKQFHTLNKTTSASKLVAGKKYFIPVLIYQYNGKSIRSTVGLKGWEQAVRIKEYNESLLKNKLRRQSLVGSNILWVPYHELNCMEEEEMDEGEMIRQERAAKVENKISGSRRFSIFGKNYAHVPLKSKKLSGKVFYVVSGHGGPDSGAVGKRGKNQMCEDEYAYDVALRLTRNLVAHGAIAYMITRDPDDGIRDEDMLPCDTDEYCWGDYRIPRSQKHRLFQRSNAINDLYEKYRKIGVKDENQSTIILHIDSRNTSHRADVFFYFYPGSTPSEKLAQKIQYKLASKYKKYRKKGNYNGTVKARDLHMLRETKPKSVYIELGNIQNKDDQRRFLRDNRQALANWLFEAL